MKKINLFAIIILLMMTTADVKAVVLNNFYMDVQVLNPLVPSTNRVDLCPGGVLQLKNISTYGNNWPAGNTLTGTYKISFSGTWGVYLPSIPASTWYYNQVWSINMPSGTNSPPYNLYIQYQPGPGEILGTNPQTQDLIYVRVIAAPLLTVSPNVSICPGSSTTLSASGASTYTWNPGGLTGSSVTVSPVTNTTYTVTGTNASGCTTTKTVSVTMLPKPQITIPTILACAGSPVTFNATVSGGGTPTYSWFISINSTTFTALPYTTSSINLTPANYAPYVQYSSVLNLNFIAVKLIVNNGYCTSEAIGYAIFQDPITYSQVQNVQVCNSSINGSPDAYFGVVAPNAFGYDWQYSNDNGANWFFCSTNTLLFTNPLTNTLIVENPPLSMNNWLFRCILRGSACPDVITNAALLTVEPCPGIRASEEEAQPTSNKPVINVTVYPNPTNNAFTVSKPGSDSAIMEVLDITGRAVKEKTTITENSMVFDFSDQPTGIYLVRITTAGKTETIRLIKQ